MLYWTGNAKGTGSLQLKVPVGSGSRSHPNQPPQTPLDPQCHARGSQWTHLEEEYFLQAEDGHSPENQG